MTGFMSVWLYAGWGSWGYSQESSYQQGSWSPCGPLAAPALREGPAGPGGLRQLSCSTAWHHWHLLASALPDTLCYQSPSALAVTCIFRPAFLLVGELGCEFNLCVGGASRTLYAEETNCVQSKLIRLGQQE